MIKSTLSELRVTAERLANACSESNISEVEKCFAEIRLLNTGLSVANVIDRKRVLDLEIGLHDQYFPN